MVGVHALIEGGSGRSEVRLAAEEIFDPGGDLLRRSRRQAEVTWNLNRRAWTWDREWLRPPRIQTRYRHQTYH